jgi:VWFA-related protein
MRIKSIVAASLCVLALLTAGLVAQQPPAAPAPQQPPARPAAGEQPPITFKVEVNYVEIDAVVTDAQGNFVRDLTKDDFLVSEQGKPQTVSSFSLVDIPIQKFDPPLYKTKPIEPDVRNNLTEFNGRVFVIVLDDLNVSFTRSGRVRAAAKQFVERYLGSNDIAAIVQTGGAKQSAQEFTNSRERLERVIDRFMGQKERSATLEKLDDYRATGGLTGPPRDMAEQIRVYKARNTFAVLKNVAEYMGGIRGRRKAVVLFSEGVDYDIYDAISNQYATEVREYGQEAIAAATRANVSFYAVDPRGLNGLEEGAGADMGGSFPDDPSLGLNMSAIQREVQIAQDSLRTISSETGGFASVNSNDYKTGFARIVQDNSSYYVLGYYSTDAKRDGTFRTLNVRVKKPGLQVRARKGYVAPKGRATPPGTPPPPAIAASIAMRDALDSPIPSTGIGLSAFAAPMAGAVANKAKATVLVIVELEGRALPFKQEGGLFANDLEVAIVATDDTGKVREGTKDNANLKLRPETHKIVASNGVRITRRIELPPGRYQLRIGARESVGGRVGSVLYDLDVPDFSKQDLAMGGILLTSAYASRIPTANPDPDFKNILPGSPSAVRVFPTGDELALAVDVYDNKPSTPHRVEIRTVLTGDDGKVVFNTREERKTEELKGAGGTYGHVAKVPLTGVAPGRYVLKVEAQSSLSNTTVASREVEITVR